MLFCENQLLNYRRLIDLHHRMYPCSISKDLIARLRQIGICYTKSIIYEVSHGSLANDEDYKNQW